MSRKPSRKPSGRNRPSKIDKRQLPACFVLFGDGPRCNEQVARVRIGMEETIFKDLFQVDIEQDFCNLGASIPAAVIAS